MALRETLKEMRDRDKKIENYVEEGRSALWVRYTVTPSGAATPGLHKPAIIVNLRSEGRGMKVDGNSRLINVVFDRYLGVNEWRDILEKHLEIRVRGWKSEERVYRAALALPADAGNPILSITPSSVHQDKDEGIDFFLICNGRGGVERVPLQCKTGAFGQSAHQTRMPGIPSLLVRDGMTDDEIRAKLLEIVNRFLDGEAVHV